MSEQNVGAIVSLTPPQDDGGFWEAKQVELVKNLPPGDIAGRKSIDWSFGPVKVSGYLDTNTLEVGLSVSVAGISLGNIYGNLKDGVGIKVNLLIAKGEIRFYLKNGNELWIHLQIKIVFDGQYEGDYKIMSF